MQATEIYNRLLHNAPAIDDLKAIEVTCNNRKEKSKFAAFLLDHKDHVYNLLKTSTSHETQLILLQIVSKTLTKKQLTKSQFFKFLTKKSTETEIYNFLVDFNFMYNHKIVGAEFENFICKEKKVNLSRGSVFLTDGTLKLYSCKNIVIINFSSIISLSVKDTKILITANENKTAEILFEKNEHSCVFLSKIKQILASKVVYDESLEFEKIIQNSQLALEQKKETSEELFIKQLEEEIGGNIDVDSNETVVKQLERELKVKFNEELNTYKTISKEEIRESESDVKNESNEKVENISHGEVKNQFNKTTNKGKEFINSSLSTEESGEKLKVIKKKKAIKKIKNNSRRKLKNFHNKTKISKKYKNVFSTEIKSKIEKWYYHHMKLIKEKSNKMKKKAEKYKKILMGISETKYPQFKKCLKK
ncbi:hypothetical protein NUSPORA_01203 [Nucleospora cyclopteri]